jgi:hypothetical protein
MATQTTGVSRWLTLNGQPLRFGPEEDNLAAKATEYEHNLFELLPGAPRRVGIRVEDETLDTAVYGRWFWRPAGFAGLYDVEVSTGGGATYRTQVRVLPSHLSQQRYEAMLKEISHLSADLLFQLHSPATERVTPDEIEQKQSPLRTYTLVAKLMDKLAAAVGQIARSPHRALVAEQQRRQWHELAEFSAGALPDPGPVVALPYSRAGLPARWPLEWAEEQHALTFDVYENRLLKHFLLRQLLPRLDELEQRAQAEIARRREQLFVAQRNKWDTAETEKRRIAELKDVIANCQAMQQRVIGWGNLSFLKPVSLLPVRAVPTQLLQKHAAYNRFYAVYLRFQQELKRGLNTEGFLTTIAVRKMSELYETWTALRLAAMAWPLWSPYACVRQVTRRLVTEGFSILRMNFSILISIRTLRSRWSAAMLACSFAINRYTPHVARPMV